MSPPRLFTPESGCPAWMRRFSNEMNKNKPGPRKKRRRSLPPSQGFTRIQMNHQRVGCTTSVFSTNTWLLTSQRPRGQRFHAHRCAEDEAASPARPLAAGGSPLLDSGRSPTYHSPRRIGTATATGRPRAAPAPTSTQGCGMKPQRLGQGQQGGPHVLPGPGSDPAAPGRSQWRAAGVAPRAPARERGRGHQRRPRAPHSHVVEAEQVIASEGPERRHCAAAAEAGSGGSRARPAGSCPARGGGGGGRENCFRATSCSATTAAIRLSLAAASGIAGSFL